MYIDFEGHRIATSQADAARELTAHEQAVTFGYDCTAPCCDAWADTAADAEASDVDGGIPAWTPQALPVEAPSWKDSPF